MNNIDIVWQYCILFKNDFDNFMCILFNFFKNPWHMTLEL